MNKQEILNIRDKGEVSRMQFKERILDMYDVTNSDTYEVNSDTKVTNKSLLWQNEE